jgi:Caspase domain
LIESKNSSETNAMRVLLIGVDYYFPNTLPDNGGYYPSLGGCVRDINYVEKFLVNDCRVPPKKVIKLTSSNHGTDSNSQQRPPEPEEKWPTYENMIAAFKQIANDGNPGDQVYIHYSGHGGRAKTIYPDLKRHTGGGLDEALVPTDIGNTEARYLRDVELAYILKGMVDKGLIVTIILDSCHSGGGTRAAGDTVTRGTDREDKNDRPIDSSVASYDELARVWKEITGFGGGNGGDDNNSISRGSSSAAARNLQSSNGWIPQPRGYVLLAACRPQESAYETTFEGERRGALTYWLLDSLRQRGSNFTYRMLHNHIAPKIHSQFAAQTPMLQGEGDRIVFGIDTNRPSFFAVNVLRFDDVKKEVLLNAGRAQGIVEDTEFEIYPRGTTDFTTLDKRIAVVKVIESGASESRAQIVEWFYGQQEIEEGCQAVLVDVASVDLIKKMTLRYEGQDVQALEKVNNAIRQSGKGSRVTLASKGETPDYQVAVNKEAEYEILDPAGIVVPHINPPLKISDPNAAHRLVQRLNHLARYSNIQELDNYDSQSPLARKLVVELFELQSNYKPGDKPKPQPLKYDGSIYTVNDGQSILLRIKNLSNQVLNVTVLDLQPDWGVSQLFPRGSDTDFMPIDPGHSEDDIVQVFLPNGYETGKDVIKAFATVGPTSFRSLELPPLDQPLTRKAMLRSGRKRNQLEAFLDAITEEEPKTRNMKQTASASHEWTTTQLEIQVTRV